jgi:hypothetical protein
VLEYLAHGSGSVVCEGGSEGPHTISGREIRWRDTESDLYYCANHRGARPTISEPWKEPAVPPFERGGSSEAGSRTDPGSGEHEPSVESASKFHGSPLAMLPPSGGSETGETVTAGTLKIMFQAPYAHVALRADFSKVEVSLGVFARPGEDPVNLLRRTRKLVREQFEEEVALADSRRSPGPERR